MKPYIIMALTGISLLTTGVFFAATGDSDAKVSEPATTVIVASDQAGQAVAPREVSLDSFQWPWLLQVLDGGDMESALQGASDGAVFAVLYIKDMNAYIKENHIFLEGQCFTEVYESQLDTKLTAILIADVVPTVLSDLGSMLIGGDYDTKSIKERWPIAGSLIKGVVDQAPSGAFERVLFTMNIRDIFRDQAHQDVAVLMDAFGCGPDTPTRRIFKNAYSFVDIYLREGR